jgi:bifunctional non-homologous end joining protein LigD
VSDGERGERGSAPSRATLDAYRSKRDFSLTPEPAGAGEGREGEGPLRFVVQRHRARRLHYDFRLEAGGVLLSWAVPKGPTLDPRVRTLAVQVEDHPIEYGDFEGVIPAGQYGAGDVIVWDRGTWQPAGAADPGAAVAGGELHFDLEGEKLRGRFVLVRTRRARSGQDQWLMLHKRDEEAREGWDPERYPRSVKSGRTNEEVAAEPEAVWRGDLPPAEAELRLPAAGRTRRPDPPDPAARPAAGRTRRPDPPDPAARPAAGRTRRPDPPDPAARPAAGRTRRPDPPGKGALPPSPQELAALDALGPKGPWELLGRRLQLTNLDKVLLPARGDEAPVTKRELVRYYAQVSPFILAYLADRPVNLHRFPNGVDRPGFWHKQVPSYAPEWLSRWRDPRARQGETDCYAVVDSPPALAWMANYGAVELHAWTSSVRDVDRPTWAYIDIDPGPETRFEDVVLLARLFRGGLDHLGVEGLPKLTGSRGLHIWIPLEPGHSFEQTRAWVHQLSRAVGATVPELVSWRWEKRVRQGRARLDYTQNARHKTLVAPYSVRAAPGAPVSVPVEWEELDDPSLSSDRFSVRTVLERLARTGDPLARLLDRPQRLPAL